MNKKNKEIESDEKQLDNMQRKLEKISEQENRLDVSYIEGKIKIESYNRLIDKISKEKEKIQATIDKLKMKPTNEVVISEAIVKRALENFEELFNKASIEEKRGLLRSVFDEINVTQDRKELKDVTITFSNNTFLPYSEIRGTVSQIVVKLRVEIEISKTVLEQINE